jgi:isopenicillin N synthase-like dioxygenase
MDSQPLSCAMGEEDALLGNFISAAHAVLLKVLNSLCELLQDDTHHLLMESHCLEESSTSTLALFRYLRGPDKEAQGHNKHTDLGTLTFLLTKQRGLQVLLPGHEGWFSVEPRLGCAIINVGDSLRFLSGRFIALSRWQRMRQTTDTRLGISCGQTTESC